MMHTLDLFAALDGPDAADVVRSFERAFDAWQAAEVASDHLQRPSTLQVYADMWGAFSGWCIAQSPAVTLASLGEEDLEAFLASRAVSGQAKGRQGELSARYRHRLLSLIDRVLTHHALLADVPKNDAATAYLQNSDEIRRAHLGEDPPLDYLDAEQARRLLTFIAAVRPGAAERRVVATWQELRNVTAVALHLGAGLTPGDVRELSVTAPVVAGGRWKDVPWKLKVPGDGNRPARETPIAPWAGQVLRHWLKVRAEAGLPAEPCRDDKGQWQGPFLLPGRRGRRWSRMGHYDAVKEVLQASGVDDPGSGSGGAFRLRHTFALRQLRRKRSAEEVARWMGIANIEEMERYRRVLDRYEEAV